MNRRITENVLGGENPGDMVDIIARDFGLAITDNEVLITVDGGDVGLLRLVSSPGLANALLLLVAKALWEYRRLCL